MKQERKKRGPYKEEQRKKRSFYATDTEWVRYQTMADDAGMTRGEWIRERLK